MELMRYSINTLSSSGRLMFVYFLININFCLYNHEADDKERSCGTSESHMTTQNGVNVCPSSADDRDVGDWEHKYSEQKGSE